MAMTSTKTALARWLIKNRRTSAWFATKIGFSTYYISKLRQGHLMPSMKTAQLIAKATGNGVSIASWFKQKKKEAENEVAEGIQTI